VSIVRKGENEPNDAPTFLQYDLGTGAAVTLPWPARTSPTHYDSGQVRAADVCHGTQDYVYHCHNVEHEDNDMMRPFRVTP